MMNIHFRYESIPNDHNEIMNWCFSFSKISFWVICSVCVQKLQRGERVWRPNYAQIQTVIKLGLYGGWGKLGPWFLKPWKCVLCIHFHVCLSFFSVCTWANEHMIWPRNPIFGLRWSVGHEKEAHIFVSRFFNAFYRHFSIVSL